MKRIIKIIILFTIYSIVGCTTQKETLISISNNDKFAILEKNGHKYIAWKHKVPGVEKCLSNDSNQDLKEEVLIIKSRKVIHRVNIFKYANKIPKQAEIKYSICIDREGDVAMARLIESSSGTTEIFLNAANYAKMEYKFESCSTAKCLECGE